ncbi:MAG: PilZ domain-containing protein [Planctomycetota bacterium]
MGVLLSLGASLRYFSWRIQATLVLGDPLSAAASLLLLGAELFAYGVLLLRFFQILSPRSRITPSLPAGSRLPTVDVIIPAGDAALAAIRRTAVCCAALDHPRKKVWILDRRRRQEVAALARELGIGLLQPDHPSPGGGEALEVFLRNTHAELVARFDPGSLPVRTFLARTAPFFLRDEKLALVQTPQQSIQADASQRNLSGVHRFATEEDLFQQVEQPGKDRWNAALFCGSNAVLRRSVVEEIGGLAREEPGFETLASIRLHAAGWKTVFLRRNLVGGEAPQRFAGLAAWRIGRARGRARILGRENPLGMRGLSLAQRLCYLASSLSFFLAVPRLIFLLAPVLYLLLGIPPFHAGLLAVAAFFLPHYLAAELAQKGLNRGIRQGFWIRAGETALAFPMALANLGLPIRLRGRRVEIPLRLLQLLSLAALVRGLFLLGIPAPGGGTVLTGLLWCGINLGLLSAAAREARDRGQKRGDPRLPLVVPVRSSWNLQGREVTVQGTTMDLSESGARILTRAPLPASVPIRLTLQGDGERVSLEAMVVWVSDGTESGWFAASLRFLDRAPATRDALIRLLHSRPPEADPFPFPRSGWAGFVHLAGAAFRWSPEQERAMLRAAHRFQESFPALLRFGEAGSQVPVTVEEISETGAFVSGKRIPVQAGERCVLALEFPSGSRVEIQAQAVRIRGTGTRMGRVLHFTAMSLPDRAALLWGLFVEAGQGLETQARAIGST